ALRLDEAARDREPEARAPRAPRRLAAPEALEHAGGRLGRQALARVLDGDHDALVPRAHEHRDRAVARRVPERVREQVEEHPLHLLGRAEDGRQRALDASLEVDVSRPRLRLERAQARLDDAVELNLAELER